MGFFRFHRSIRIGPGLRVNLSKSGAPESIGGRGAWFTIGPRGTRATVWLPGTGLSYTEKTPVASSSRFSGAVIWALALGLIAVLLRYFL